MNTKNEWVDVHDFDLMVALGIHQPAAQPRDPSIWTKTSQEKKMLRKVRNKTKMHTGVNIKRSTPVYNKLIVQLKKNDKFPNTTYSLVCGLHQIDEYLRYFSIITKKEQVIPLVNKYYFNGKWYKAEERPYWPSV